MDYSIDYYKEQLQAKEDMLARTTRYLADIHEVLENKNKILSEKNHDIFSSIKFAELIQKSLLPDTNILKTFASEGAYAVIQQIGIGGDAVFIKKAPRGVFFGLLDSTGHGVPAAMLSISTCLLLRELTSSTDIEAPGTLLTLLSSQLTNTFNSSTQSIAHVEGTLCFLPADSNKFMYASAKGKVIKISKSGSLTELASDKYSVGETSGAQFNSYDLDLEPGEKLVFFSDGLVDQFGGERDKKFSKARLKKILGDNYLKNVNDLHQLIIAAHLEWKDLNEQTDDISLLILQF